MSELQKAAEILVECGYKMTSTYYDSCAELQHHKEYEVDKHIDPFSDTLEGRRQADAIEDWLRENEREVWHKKCLIDEPIPPYHQWRLDRIKYCLQQLEGDV